MKHQLSYVHSPGSSSDQNLIKSQVLKLNKIYKDSDNLTKDNKLTLSQNNFFTRARQSGSMALPNDNMRRSHGSFTGVQLSGQGQDSDRLLNGASNTIQSDHPHYRLFRDGVKVTLGNSPVKFGRKVYLSNNTPSCAVSKIPIPGQTNPLGVDMEKDNFKLMPSKKRLSPLRTP